MVMADVLEWATGVTKPRARADDKYGVFDGKSALNRKRSYPSTKFTFLIR